jgi:hypothetical protein
VNLVRRVEWVIGAASALAVLAGCVEVVTHSADAGPGGPVRRRPNLDVRPTEEQARSQIGVMVEAALTKDKVRYCSAVGYPILCEEQWDSIGGAAAVPSTPPRLIGMREDTGARILILCGRDGLGRLYRSEIPVFTFADGVRIQAVPYWQDFTFHGVFTDDSPFPVTEEPEPSHPPECG